VSPVALGILTAAHTSVCPEFQLKRCPKLISSEQVSCDMADRRVLMPTTDVKSAAVIATFIVTISAGNSLRWARGSGRGVFVCLLFVLLFFQSALTLQNNLLGPPHAPRCQPCHSASSRLLGNYRVSHSHCRRVNTRTDVAADTQRASEDDVHMGGQSSPRMQIVNSHTRMCEHTRDEID